MTGCMYISPESLVDGQYKAMPLMFADIVATKRDSRAAVKVVPANINSKNSSSESSIIITRKIYIISKRSVIAVSGNSEPIDECLNEFYFQMPAWLSAHRPMELVQNMVNEFKDINILGASIDPTTSIVNHLWPKADLKSLKILRTCAAIGSGKAELWAQAARFERQVSLKDFDPVNTAIAFSRMVNNYVLCSEVNGNITDWGGYIESVYVAPDGKEWKRGDSEVHFFYLCKPSGQGLAEVFMINRVIGYDPGGVTGRIISQFGDDNGYGHREFILENLIEDDEISDLPSTDEFWKDWVPKQASISFILDVEKREKNFTVTLAGDQISNITFEYDKGVRRAGVKKLFFDEICVQACAQFGFQYSPFKRG